MNHIELSIEDIEKCANSIHTGKANRMVQQFGTNVNEDCIGVEFYLNNTVIECVTCICYLRFKLLMKRKLISVDVSDRIRKFNAAAYDILIKTKGICKSIRCELIRKQCLPILLCGLGNVRDFEDDIYIYKASVAYRSIYRYIFRLSSRSRITEFLNVFGIIQLLG
jgi:hypothetical protein